MNVLTHRLQKVHSFCVSCDGTFCNESGQWTKYIRIEGTKSGQVVPQMSYISYIQGLYLKTLYNLFSFMYFS